MQQIYDIENNFEKYIEYLYEDLTGFITIEQSKESLAENHVHPTYGEILTCAINKVIQYIKVDVNDVFYDLGCGIGKVVTNFFLKTPIKKSCGIEAINKRFDAANKIYTTITKDPKLQELLSEKFCSSKLLEFKLGNFVSEQLDDATIIFMNDVAYSYATIDKLANKINELSNLKYLICYHKINNFKYLTQHNIIQLQFSWHSKDSPGCDYNIYSNPSILTENPL